MHVLFYQPFIGEIFFRNKDKLKWIIFVYVPSTFDISYKINFIPDAIVASRAEDLNAEDDEPGNLVIKEEIEQDVGGEA